MTSKWITIWIWLTLAITSSSTNFFGGMLFGGDERKANVSIVTSSSLIYMGGLETRLHSLGRQVHLVRLRVPKTGRCRLSNTSNFTFLCVNTDDMSNSAVMFMYMDILQSCEETLADSTVFILLHNIKPVDEEKSLIEFSQTQKTIANAAEKIYPVEQLDESQTVMKDSHWQEMTEHFQQFHKEHQALPEESSIDPTPPTALPSEDDKLKKEEQTGEPVTGNLFGGTRQSAKPDPDKDIPTPATPYYREGPTATPSFHTLPTQVDVLEPSPALPSADTVVTGGESGLWPYLGGSASTKETTKEPEDEYKRDYLALSIIIFALAGLTFYMTIIGISALQGLFKLATLITKKISERIARVG